MTAASQHSSPRLDQAQTRPLLGFCWEHSYMVYSTRFPGMLLLTFVCVLDFASWILLPV